MKHVSHVDLINEKRRLAVELEDAKHRKILKKDIKVLRKQIELLENGNNILILTLNKSHLKDITHAPKAFFLSFKSLTDNGRENVRHVY